jgi:hypothetical protein
VALEIAQRDLSVQLEFKRAQHLLADLWIEGVFDLEPTAGSFG